jgi:sugar lactone lactonase YvrE
MKKCDALVAVLGVVIIGFAVPLAQSHVASVIRLDATLDGLVAPDAQLQPVKSGFGFTEGLTWYQKGNTGYLLFSDIPANVINKMTADGKVSVVVDQSGYHGPWNGYAMMRVGHPQHNGNDPKDPDYVEYIMIGADGTNVDTQGRLVCAFHPS